MVRWRLGCWGVASSHAGDDRGAEPPVPRARALHEQERGAPHPEGAGSLNNLAALSQAQGRDEREKSASAVLEPDGLTSLIVVCRGCMLAETSCHQ